MKRAALIGAWFVATGATTAIAYVAVNAAGAEVTDRPLTSIVATTTTIVGTSTAATVTTSTSPVTTSGTPTSETTSTTAPSTTTPSSAPVTTTAWQQTTISSIGGLVIVSY
ncbi:MAG: hypothetical protein ACRDWH_08080, partial [Acidimicrobiia bacterium]